MTSRQRAAAVRHLACCLALAASCGACVDTGQDRVSVPLEVAGTARDEPIQGRAGFAIDLVRAEIAFGPLYLCAGALAGDNCDAARLEWRDSVVVDALAPEPFGAGDLVGVSGEVRSAMYDLGIPSLLTATHPVELAAATALSGNSVRLAGTATRGAESLAFELQMPIAQAESAERGLPIVRVSGAPELVRDVTGEELALRVRFDPSPWLRDIDFEAVAGAAEEDPFGPDGQAQRAVRGALLSGARPAFEWLTLP